MFPRQIWHILLASLAVFFLLSPSQAESARILADARNRILDFDSAAVPGVVTASGRACAIDGLFGRIDEDPVAAPGVSIGGCAGGFRALPPNAIASFVGIARGEAEFRINPVTGNKEIVVVASSLFGTADAEAKDPIIFDPVPSPRRIASDITLSRLEIESEVDRFATFHLDFSSNVTGTLPLFSLDVAASGGGNPIVDFGISSLLGRQPGWIESVLERQLRDDLLAGMVSAGSFAVANFPLPRILLDVPANMQTQIFTDHLAVAGVPEPSTFMLLSLGTLALLGYGWRRRKRERSMAARVGEVARRE